jgi:hypothetical protein
LEQPLWDGTVDALPALELKLSDELAEDVFAAWGDSDSDALALDLL